MKFTAGAWRLSIGLAIVGMIDSVYLTWLHVSNSSALCTGFGGCDSVQQSIYSEVAGIPIALFGLVGYLAVLALLFAEKGKGTLATGALYTTFGLTLVGTLYSVYLTYIELFVIDAVCPYCVISALAMLLVVILAGYRLAATSPAAA